MSSRKAVFAALYALASGAAGFQTKSRTVRLFSDVAAPDQPAFFQSEGKQVRTVSAPGTQGKDTWHAELILYAHEANVPEGGDVVDLLNDLVDAVLAALAPPLGVDKQTLGGLVTDCRVDGTIDTSEGRLGQQAVAVIPVVIIATH